MVQPIPVSWKYRAALLCVVANRQHEIESLLRKFINDLRAMARDVDSNLFHNGNRFGPNVRCLGTGAFNIEGFPVVMAHEAFGHLGPGRIGRAENQ
jgi:hypothetical protein